MKASLKKSDYVSGRTLPWLTSALVSALLSTAAVAQSNEEYFQLGEDEPVPGLAPGVSVTDLGQVSRVVQVDMRAGDELMSGLLEYVQTERPVAGRMTGIGGFESAEFAYYDPEAGAFKRIPVDAKGEVVSFIGVVSYQDGEASVHVHAVMSLADGTTRGGHVVSAQIAPIMQVFVFELSGTE